MNSKAKIVRMCVKAFSLECGCNKAAVFQYLLKLQKNTKNDTFSITVRTFIEAIY